MFKDKTKYTYDELPPTTVFSVLRLDFIQNFGSLFSRNVVQQKERSFLFENGNVGAYLEELIFDCHLFPMMYLPSFISDQRNNLDNMDIWLRLEHI